MILTPHTVTQTSSPSQLVFSYPTSLILYPAMTAIDLSETDVTALMGLLLENQSHAPSCQSSDPIVETSCEGEYCTLSRLQKDFCQIVADKGGRYSLLSGSEILGVSVDQLQSAMQQNELKGSGIVIPILSLQFNQQGEIVQVATEYVSNNYLDHAAKSLAQVLEKQGTMLLSEAILSLPVKDSNSNVSITRTREDDDYWLQLLEYRMEEQGMIVKAKDNGSRVLTTKAFWISFASQVYETIHNLQSQKLLLSNLCQEHSWDPSWVREILEYPPETMTSPQGELQGGSVFIPKLFKEAQSRAITEALHYNGFVITHELAAALDTSASQVLRCIQQQEDNVWILANKSIVVSHERLVMPWISLIQEANAASSWCEVSLPLELLRYDKNGSSMLLDRLVRESDSHSLGVASCISEEADGDACTALYFSPSMISLVKSQIPLMLSAYCKGNAKSILENNGGGSIPLPELMDEDSPIPVVPPTQLFVELVLRQCPTLSDSQTVLLDLCDRAFAKEPGVRKMAATMMHNEIERLQKIAKASVIHVSAATSDGQDFAEQEETIVPFEDHDCFHAACFRIQLLWKFYEYSIKHGIEDSDKLADEILGGICMDFTRRIHLSASTKREDLPPFSFSFHDPNDKSFRAPSYCSAIDTAAIDLGRPLILGSTPDPSTGMARDPMQLILEFFPGFVGRALYDLYAICQPEGDDATPREVRIKEYMQSVEEHTLTICGLPFKKLDKKSEKSFLQNRMIRLRSRLQDAKNPKQILELTIMILYQAIRNVYVAGSLLLGPILEMLSSERKINATVGNLLTELASQINNGQKEVDPSLVETVRGCGMCKDISKHVPS